MSRTVTVAIPVRDGGRRLGEVFDGLAVQRLPAGTSMQVLVCDSGSRDGSLARARAAGAEVFSIATETFSHGGTRNLLMRRAEGEHVAFLTQDAVPAGPGWLAELIGGFDLAPDVGLAYGPYLPRAGASIMVARELDEWFMSVGAAPVVHRLAPGERATPARELLGARGYFTDANGAVARAAWAAVPFREVPYAEDHVLAHDMLRHGFAKAYVPAAAVVHSHDYTLLGWLRRSFDEARPVAALYDFAELGAVGRLGRWVWGSVGADLRYWRAQRAAAAVAVTRPASGRLLARSAAHHLARACGTALGVRAERLPAGLVRQLSLERRG